MYPTFPLNFASIRDLCEAEDHLYTQLEIGDKTYYHNIFSIYTYNGETLILVDTTVSRTVRLCHTVDYKRSVIIKDVTGNAGDSPIVISVIGDGVTLNGSMTREYQMYVPFGAVELSAFQAGWTITSPRSSVISDRSYRLPQNLSFILPPATGSQAQNFPAMVYFPASVLGAAKVDPGYNGFTASDYYLSQLTPTDSTATMTGLFGQPDPPAAPSTDFSMLSITSDTIYNVPGDFATLNAALSLLSVKVITPGVKVKLNLNQRDSLSAYTFNHPQSSAITISGAAPDLITPISAHPISTVAGNIVLDIQLSVSDLASVLPGAMILIDKTLAHIARWAGAWPVSTVTTNSVRVIITDSGANFPADTSQPGDARYRVLNSVVSLAGPLTVQGEGLTIQNIAFVGSGGNTVGLDIQGRAALSTLALNNFIGTALRLGYNGVQSSVVPADLFVSANEGDGINLFNSSVIDNTSTSSTTGLYITGNDGNGLAAEYSSVKLSSFFIGGNVGSGIKLNNEAYANLTSGVANNNGTGLRIDGSGLAVGNNNTFANNTALDISAVNDSKVLMTLSAGNNLSSPNGQITTDGSLISL